MSSATWAHAGYALGYAEHGHFPIASRFQAECLALQESAEFYDDPSIAGLVIEAGRAAGKRSAREKAHRKLYDYHGDELAGLLGIVLARLDRDALAEAIVAKAKEQADAGYSPVDRRKAVQAIALATIAAHVSAEDRQSLDAANAMGWAHATAYGIAEAQATSDKGGPPNPAKVTALTVTALAQIDVATAAEASATWTALEIQTIAMGAALAAGDASALGEATRAVKASLIDSGRATRVYADQLHAAVTQAYIAQTQAQTPGVLYDWQTADDPCDICEDNADDSPYEAGDIPDYPPHPGCLCDIEAVAAVLVDA